MARLLTVPETAAFLRIAPGTLRMWCCQRRIPFRKVGGRVVFSEEDLESFLKSCRVEPSEGGRNQ